MLSIDGDTLYAMAEQEQDEQLMLRYAAGDVDAFEVLYQRHKGPVYRYMLNLCRKEAVAEELFQEVWIKLINARENYVASAKFTTYLYKLAHNQFIDHYRRQNVRIVEERTEYMDVYESGQNNPDEQMQLSQLQGAFFNVLASLNHEQREVFLLREESNMNLQEISETVGISHEAAKSRLRYAIKKLRSIITNET